MRLELNGSGQPNVIAGDTNNAVAPGLVGAVIGGGATNTIGSGSHWAVIGGGRGNSIRDNSSVAGIASGFANEIQPSASFAFVGGGYNNRVQTNASAALIGGGYANTIGANSPYSLVAGGRENVIRSNVFYASIGGGYRNTNQTAAHFSAIGGGYLNTIQSNAPFSVIGGGYVNVISNDALYATVIGGNQNVVGGSYGLAAGNRAKANHRGTFVWADSTAADLASTADNQFLIRSTGGVGIGTNKPASLLHVMGTVTATNFVGSGAGLSNLPPTSLTGILSASQIPSLDATKITTGIIADARLSTSVARLNGNAGFTGTVSAASFAGNGGGLTGVPGTLPYKTVAGLSQIAVPNTAYLLTNPGLTSVTLPLTPNVGDLVRVIGYGGGIWRIMPTAGQMIDAAGMPGSLDPRPGRPVIAVANGVASLRPATAASWRQWSMADKSIFQPTRD